MSNIQAIKYKKIRNRLEAAFKAYKEGKLGAEADLFTAVLSFARGKVTSAIYDQHESSMTADDHAQEVAIRVWTKIKTFSGDPGKFYPWLHRICYTEGIDAFKECKKISETHVPLQIEDEDGFFEDNPKIRTESTSEVARKLPEFIVGIDKSICDLIRDGQSYARIGEILSISENAVGLRIRKMRARIKRDAMSKEPDSRRSCNLCIPDSYPNAVPRPKASKRYHDVSLVTTL